MSGNTFNFHGPIKAQIINVGSTLTNVSQTVNSLQQGNSDERAELNRLIEELKAELTKAPEDKVDEAEAISKLTKDAVECLEKKQPKAMLSLSLRNLKEAGTWVIDTLPKVPKTIDSLVSIIEKIS